MTTPAVNSNTHQNVTTSGVQKNYTYPGGVLISQLPASASFTSREEYRVRPASGTSPLRTDGTRAPRAWDHRWGLIVATPKGKTTFDYLATGNQRRTVELPFAQYHGTGSTFSSVGLTWLNGNDVAQPPLQTRMAATTKFRNKALDGVAELGVTAGEFRQTARMVAELCERLVTSVDRAARWSMRQGESSQAARRRAYRLLKNGRVDTRRRERETKAAYNRRIAREKSILSDWLTVQFGLVPLVSDIESSAAALSYLLEQPGPKRVTVRAGAEFTFPVKVVTSGPPPAPSMPTPITAEWDATVISRCHFSGTFDVPMSTDRTIRQLGLGNPATVLWELTRFSWLWDYGIGVGEWLKSMTPLDHMKWIEGSRSEFVTLIQAGGSLRYRPKEPSGINKITGGGNIFCDCSRFKREVLLQTPVAAAFPIPKNKLNLTRLANVLAVMAGVPNDRGLRI